MCPPSARLGEQFPDTASEYAAAGTLAHAIAELKARKYFVEPMSTRTFNARLKKLKEDPHYDKGMDAATDTYLEHLKALAISYGSVQPFVALETRVDFGDYVPEGFGTADCIIIGAGRMCVADYKNGAGVLVEAEANPQMMLYALGALKVYAPIYGHPGGASLHCPAQRRGRPGVGHHRGGPAGVGRKGGQARRRPGLGGEGRLCPGRVVPVLPGPGAVLRPGS